MLEISDIPPELTEVILDRLSAHTLFITAQVCKLWRSISSRICKLRCRGMHDEIVNEWIVGDDGDELRWILMCHTLEIDKCFFEQDYRGKETFWEENNYTTNIWGPWLLVVDASKQTLRVYDEATMEQPYIIPIDNIEEVQTTSDLVVVRTTTTTAFYKPDLLDNTAMRCLEVCGCDVTLLTAVQLMSVSSKYLAIATCRSEITVFSLSCKQDKVVLDLLTTFQTPSLIFLSLWNEELIYTTYAGTVETYDLTSMSPQCAICHNEIQYANPTWSLRGAILCSTTNLRVLMGYWHLHSGFPQNLFGRPTQPLEECSIWDNDEDVISASILGRFIAIGTSAGNVAIYYLSDAYFTNDNKLMAEELSRVPEICHECCIQPKILHLQYTVNGIRFFISDRDAIAWVDYDVYVES